ncbi:rhomboid family intramembrane serine protease [Aurantivibrio plasticivorans]
MIILPTEKSFDWQHAPVVLISIVLLNVFVFFFYQSNDSAKFEQAYTTYESTGLLEIEWPIYKQYLIDQGETELAEEYQEYVDERAAIDSGDESYWQEEYGDDYNEVYSEDGYSEDEYSEEEYAELDFFFGDVSWALLGDFDFKRHIMENQRDVVPDAVYFDWKKARSDVNSHLEAVSFYRFGLIPTELSIIDFITSQFLHGDVMHLLGNMFFLLVCGFAVEAALGHMKFLGFYLLSGIIAGAAQVVSDLGSSIPSLGASGAISGVMAMYLGVFRFKKIEFFYWFFVFVGYFRAPAMLILPFYIGKELYSYAFDEGSNVAFMAHAGGFLGGAILIAVNQMFFPASINEEYIETDQKVNPYQDRLSKVYRAIENYQFASAIKALNDIIEEYGLDFRLARLQYNLTKISKGEDYTRIAKKLLIMKADNERELSAQKQVWEENPELAKELDMRDKIEAAMRFCSESHFSLAEAIFKGLYANKAPHNDLAILARKMAAVAQDMKEYSKQKAYENFVKKVVGV